MTTPTPSRKDFDMKCRIPVSRLNDADDNALPVSAVVGYGQLADRSGRRFTLLLDDDRQRFVLRLEGGGAHATRYNEFAKAMATPLDDASADPAPGHAVVDLRAEDRPNAPGLDRIKEVEGAGELCRARNGWCIALRAEGRTLTVDVVHLATQVSAAASAEPNEPVTEQEPVPPAGAFRSEKYPWCQDGFVALKLTDKDAQDLLWEYAERHRARDAKFSDDLQAALQNAAYAPTASQPNDPPPSETKPDASPSPETRSGGTQAASA